MALAGRQWSNALDTAAAAYGVNPAVVRAINRREQSGTSNFVVNDWDTNAAAGTPSGGPFQFIKPTYTAFARQARQANPAAWKGVSNDWRNPYAQALAASWAFANGKGSHWSTYEKALSDAGGRLRGVRETRPAPVSGAASDAAGVSSTSSGSASTERFSAPQRAALTAVFDTNPRMQRILGLVDRVDAMRPRVDVVRPAGAAADAVTGGAGAGPAGQQLVATALAEVGKTANDAMRYIRAGGGTGYEAWCGDFVMWVFKQRGLKAPPARSVPALMTWARKNNKLVSNPRPGDLVTFDWNGDGTADHVEMVRRRVKGGVATIGGNTSGNKAASQVAAKNRTSNILGYVRAA